MHTLNVTINAKALWGLGGCESDAAHSAISDAAERAARTFASENNLTLSVNVEGNPAEGDDESFRLEVDPDNDVDDEDSDQDELQALADDAAKAIDAAIVEFAKAITNAESSTVTFHVTAYMEAIRNGEYSGSEVAVDALVAAIRDAAEAFEAENGHTLKFEVNTNPGVSDNWQVVVHDASGIEGAFNAYEIERALEDAIRDAFQECYANADWPSVSVVTTVYAVAFGHGAERMLKVIHEAIEEFEGDVDNFLGYAVDGATVRVDRSPNPSIPYSITAKIDRGSDENVTASEQQQDVEAVVSIRAALAATLDEAIEAFDEEAA